jgi:hypothetical protein
MAFDDESDDDFPVDRRPPPLTESEAFWAIILWSIVGLVAVLLYAAFAPPMYH